MEYRNLGSSSLKVSVIGFGNWVTSEFPEQLERNKKCIKKAWDLGINFFDTAEIYGRGEAERQLGEALKELNVPRSDLVITTKIFFGTDPDNFPNSRYLSRKHIIEGLRNSLKRLQLEYVDVYYAHRCEHQATMEEICRAFDWCVRQGLCHYWATSEWSAAEILEAYGVCEKLDLVKPIAEQPQYNLYHRERFEVEYDRLFEKYQMGTTIWSPLFQGLLTGKYNNGIDKDGRLANPESLKDNGSVKRIVDKFFNSEEGRKQTLNQLQGLGKIAEELGCSQAQLAMAWVIKNKDVSVAITGASREEQLVDIVKSIEVYKKITGEVEEKINQLFQNKPMLGFDFKNKCLRKLRREYI